MNQKLAELWVPGRPKPAERPRFFRGRAYTPKATLDAEDQIAEAWRDHGFGTFEQPLFLVVDYDETGQSIQVWEAGWDSPLRGDIDNYNKTTMDGLQKGGAFVNDRQVVHLWAGKH